MHSHGQVATTTTSNDAHRANAERTQLIKDHLGVVEVCAAELRRGATTRGVPFEDIVGYGCEGLIDAVDKFEPDRGVHFLYYARRRIRGAMIDGVRMHHRLPKREYWRLRDAGAGLTNYFDPTDGEATISAYTRAQAAGPTRDTMEPDFSDSVRKEVKRLPRLERRLLELTYFEGKSLTDASADLGIQKSWGSRVHTRALVALSSVLLQ
jgi:RNA polymerase sigma factor (sigma-70 family)